MLNIYETEIQVNCAIPHKCRFLKFLIFIVKFS